MRRIGAIIALGFELCSILIEHAVMVVVILLEIPITALLLVMALFLDGFDAVNRENAR